MAPGHSAGLTPAWDPLRIPSAPPWLRPRGGIRETEEQDPPRGPHPGLLSPRPCPGSASFLSFPLILAQPLDCELCAQELPPLVVPGPEQGPRVWEGWVDGRLHFVHRDR